MSISSGILLTCESASKRSSGLQFWARVWQSRPRAGCPGVSHWMPSRTGCRVAAKKIFLHTLLLYMYVNAFYTYSLCWLILMQWNLCILTTYIRLPYWGFYVYFLSMWLWFDRIFHEILLQLLYYPRTGITSYSGLSQVEWREVSGTENVGEVRLGWISTVSWLKQHSSPWVVETSLGD